MARNTSARGAQAGGAAAPGRKPANPVLNAVLVAVIVLLAVGAFAATRVLAGGQSAASGAQVVIRDADGGEHRMSLDEDGELTVTSSAGTNVVQVEGGRVRVREADCPNQDCVSQGWVDDASQQIVCLPHKLYVSIEGAESATGVDVVGR
ncbi:MAG: NusG domain II-containing protein [Coriobacteriia bacterium]|nr:NusG domain II-containing protein [Coriobacteriia bacterium]